MKMTEREQGYEIDNTTGSKFKALPIVCLCAMIVVVLVWRFVL